MTCVIKLKKSSILQVPFHIYQKDFTFIINGERIETNKFVADLLSPKISKIHVNEPTFSEYSITTRSKGNFQNILNLIKFGDLEINETEIPYLSEIVDQLGIEQISINIPSIEITCDNVIGMIKEHAQTKYFYKSNLENEIDFVSEHFSELNSEQIEDLMKVGDDILEQIIGNEKLSLESEDQLLRFVSDLYEKDVKYSNFYEYVIFSNVELSSMKEFISKFDQEDLTRSTWESLAKCLLNEKVVNDRRYRMKRKSVKEIPFSDNNLKGIFSYLRTQSDINDEVKVTYSSHGCGDAKLLLDIENSKNFYTKDLENSWICFEFTNHKIIPSNYTIKSCNNGTNGNHLKSWKIEVSEDGNSWTKVDEQKDCPSLNGPHQTHTFPIDDGKIESKEEGIKYIRIYMTGPNWYSPGTYYYLDLCSIEFYGELF